MAQWGNEDASSNSVLWAPAKLKLAPNTANRDLLYQNNTPDAFVTGETVGQYGVDAAEISTGLQQLSGVVLNEPGTSGSYEPGEILDIADTGATSTSDASLVVVSTELRTVTVNTAGSGYANGDLVALDTGTGSAAILEVTTGASDTEVASLSIENRGVYTANPDAADGATVAQTGEGSGLTVDTAMRIHSLGINSVGSYSTLPTTLTGNALDSEGSGEGATADLSFAVVGAGSVAHTGWVLRKEGTGGRAGRVQTEVLVAGGIITDNDDDDSAFPGGVT